MSPVPIPSVIRSRVIFASLGILLILPGGDARNYAGFIGMTRFVAEVELILRIFHQHKFSLDGPYFGLSTEIVKRNLLTNLVFLHNL